MKDLQFYQDTLLTKVGAAVEEFLQGVIAEFKKHGILAQIGYANKHSLDGSFLELHIHEKYIKEQFSATGTTLHTYLKYNNETFSSYMAAQSVAKFVEKVHQFYEDKDKYMAQYKPKEIKDTDIHYFNQPQQPR